jgi:signal transduction histidine kinase/DNA-binding response OmpR family regulator
VTDGLTAAEVLRTDPPDLLVTDYFLANVDGSKLCRLAKSLDGRTTRTVIVTAAIDAGANDKPPINFADAVIAKNNPKVVMEDLLQVVSSFGRGDETLQEPLGVERLEPRMATAKLVGLKRYLDTLHESIGDAVLGIDDQVRVFFLNRQACQLLDTTETAAVARPLQEILDLASDDPLLDAIHAALAGEPPRTVSLEVDDVHLRVNVAGLKNPDGAETALLIARDVTDIHAAEKERMQLHVRLHQTEKMVALGQLTAGVSHEINNPLAAILPNLGALREYLNSVVEHYRRVCSGAPADELEAYREVAGLDEIMRDIPALLGECQQAAQRIFTITREMRQFAHPNAPEGEPARVEDLVNSALALAGNQLRFHATVIRNYQPTPPIVVSRSLLTQAFLNIIVNAVQALPDEDADHNWVQLSTFHDTDGVRVEISNSGDPIPAEDLPRIFEPFFTTRGVSQGLGLGLSLCYDAVRRHGGHVEVKSGPGQATTFIIHLPLDTGVIEKSQEPAPAPEPKPHRVLVIEDERPLRHTMNRILSSHHEVTLAESGPAAIKLFEDGELFDVVICDLIMPGMTGMKLFAETVHRWPEQAERFVFLTGGTFSSEARDFLASTELPRAYKPLGSKEILQLVASAIDRFEKAD